MDGRKPDILVDGRALLEPRSGGVFEYVRRLTDALRLRGRLDLRVWANSAAAEAVLAGVDVLTRWPNRLLNAAALVARRPVVRALSGPRPDVLWMPNLHFAAAPEDVPLALTVHDLSFERYPEFFSGWRRLWHRLVDPARLCRRADVVLAVSDQTKADLIDAYGLPAERVAVTPEGVSERFFRAPWPAELEALRRRRKLPERFILHIGAFEPRKNHLALLEAFHRLKRHAPFRDLGLVLAGPPGWKNAAVHAAIDGSPFRQDIRPLGFVDEEERRGLYRLASVFAFPSFYEGFGLPPLEAMASGTPVVASHAASLGEVVGDAGLLADPYRPGEIADAIRAILESPSLAALLSERGRVRAAGFTWDACAEKTERALLSVVR